MKPLFSLLLILALSFSLQAQDIFQQELFSTDLVMKYRLDINLSEQQAAQVKKVHSGQIEAFNNTKWDLDGVLHELNKQLALTKVDEAVAMTQMDKVFALEESLKRMRLSLMVKIKNILTAEQQGKLKVFRLQGGDPTTPTFQISSINGHPRMVLKIKGDADTGVQPLYVVYDKNGKKTFVTAITHISPDEIESVNVLKGDAALKMYGEDGKNGVVEITMKK